ncbi:hypothetical protein NLM33_39815 [Bradyrhizobium sp. CCGUVB1N3]|uniref:hypothetical protein n=1 Tax=Bradyrhizobium sp. CCGUVB1N3 TaxID=2949629 RepID=UPI0020B18970|nr:hypothetical protein [Bradyrhizobium sp. CCGUVB1N3]MCP3476369.1 hypothetical protein [Bradyrhizobium sp. CCGUVB1N3]
MPLPRRRAIFSTRDCEGWFVFVYAIVCVLAAVYFALSGPIVFDAGFAIIALLP